MRFVLKHALCAPGDPGRSNEDAWFATNRTIGVLDGTSGVGRPILNGPSDGQWLASNATRLLRDLSHGVSLRECIRVAAAGIEDRFARERLRDTYQNYEIPFASIMLARVADDRRLSFAWLGDVGAVVQCGTTVSVVGDFLSAYEREGEFAASLLNPGAGSVDSVNIANMLNARNRVNTDGGRWLFGPHPRCADQVQEATLEIREGAHIAIFSDGFGAPLRRYNLVDIDGLVALVRHGGLNAIFEHARSLEHRPGDRQQYPRFKMSDDATCILCEALAA